MKHFRHAISIILLLTIVRTAQSTTQRPVLDIQRSLSSISNVTSSTVLGDISNPNRFYVLPPNSGRVELKSVSFSENTQFCDEMFQLQETSRMLTGQLAEMALSIEPFQARLDELYEEVEELKRQAAEYYVSSRLLAEINELLYDIEELEWEIEDLRFLNNCEDGECPEHIQLLIDDLQSDIDLLEREYERQHDIAMENQREYAAIMMQVEEKESVIDALIAERTERIESILVEREEIHSLYSDYARLQGGKASIKYNADWFHNVERLAGDNPGNRFETIHTNTVRVHASLAPGIGTDSYLASNPSLLSYTVNGIAYDPDDPDFHLDSYPQTIVIDTALSLVGACPQLMPELVDVDKSENGLPLYAISVSYEYPIVSRYRVVVTYNLWNIFEYLVRYNSLDVLDPMLIDNLPTSAIRIRWLAQDIPPQMRTEFKREIVAELVFKILTRIARPHYVSNTRPLPIVPTPIIEIIQSRRSSANEILEKLAIDDQVLLKTYYEQTDLTVEALPQFYTLLSSDFDTRNLKTSDFETYNGLPEWFDTDKIIEVRTTDFYEVPTTDLYEEPTIDLYEVPTIDLYNEEYLMYSGDNPQITKTSLSSDSGDTIASILFEKEVAFAVVSDTTLDRYTFSISINDLISTDILKKKLIGMGSRIVLNATWEVQRSRDFKCGWYSPRCAGIDWLFLFHPEIIRRYLDVYQTYELSRDEIRYRPGTTLYSP